MGCAIEVRAGVSACHQKALFVNITINDQVARYRMLLFTNYLQRVMQPLDLDMHPHNFKILAPSAYPAFVFSYTMHHRPSNPIPISDAYQYDY